MSPQSEKDGEPDMFRLESSQDCRHTCGGVTKGCYRAAADRGSSAGSGHRGGIFSLEVHIADTLGLWLVIIYFTGLNNSQHSDLAQMIFLSPHQSPSE